MQGFFVFLRDQGVLAQSPIQLPRHQILVPTRLPRPMAEAEVVAFFRVIDALQDRTMFLLMLRCGLRVSEVSGLRWAAHRLWPRAPCAWTTVKGRWIGWSICPPMSPPPSGSGSGSRPPRQHYVFPSRMTRKGGLPLGARQIRNRMTRYLKLAGITKRLFAPLAAAYVCHPAPQCRRLAGGGQRADGAPLAPDDPPLYATL